MNEQLLKNTKIDEDIAIASRRKFLMKLVCGSLMALSGSEIATAAVRHVVHPRRNKHGHEHARPVHAHARKAQSRHRAHPTHVSHSHTRKAQSRHSTHPTHVSHSYARKAESRIITRHTPATYRHAAEHKMLAFEHTHTGDKLKLTYFENGSYIEEALQEINYLLRDFRTDDIHPIDTALLDQLFILKQTLGVNKPFHIISGYRSPLTNAQLRRHSHGVAEHSFHMQGKAIDIRLEGVSSKTIRNAALTLAQGGVGYYPRDNFVHLDTGEFRTW